VEVKGSMIQDLEEETLVFLNFVDLRKIKADKKELKVSQESLSIAVEHAGLNYFEIDPLNHEIVFVHPSFTDFIPYQKAGIFPENVIANNYIHPEDIDKYQKAFEDIYQNNCEHTSYEVRVKRGKEYIWRQGYVNAIKSKGIKLKIIVTESELQLYKEIVNKYETLIDQHEVIICSYEIQKNRLIIKESSRNSGLINYLGEVVGKDLFYVIRKSEIILENEKQAIINKFVDLREGVKEVDFKLNLHLENDLVKTFRFYFSLEVDEYNNPLRALGSAKEITESEIKTRKYNELQMVTKNIEDENTSKFIYNVTKKKIEDIYGKNNNFKNNDKSLLENITVYVDGKIVEDDYQKLSNYLKESNLLRLYNSDESFKYFEVKVISDLTIKQYGFRGKLLLDPNSKNIMLFLSINDISNQKNTSDLITSIVENDLEFAVHVNLVTNNFILYNPNDKDIIKGNDFYDELEGRISKGIMNDSKKSILDILEKRNLKASLDASDILEFYYDFEQNNSISHKKITVKYKDKKANIAFIIVSDISKIVSRNYQQNQILKEALEASKQASNAKSIFLSSMSHDMRTPLNGIIGMASTALKKSNNKALVNESLSVILDSSKLLLSLINDILDLSKIESGKLEWKNESISLHSFFSTIKNQFSYQLNEKNLNFDLIYTDINNLTVVTDEARLSRIFTNLIGNAIKFTPYNGSIECRVEELDHDGNSNYATYRFKIIDSGIGMSKKELEHIFQPFYQARRINKNTYTGTGLGLSIVSNLVDAFSGTIEVDSEIAFGTTFTVYLQLPIAKNKIIKKERVKVKDTNSFKNKKILIVDDNSINRIIMKRLLEVYKINTIEAVNGLEVYQLFKQNKLSDVDCVLMDMQMPVMNGIDATKKIRKLADIKSRTIPIIAVSANVFMDDIQSCLKAGMNDHLAKPIESKKLLAILMKYL